MKIKLFILSLFVIISLNKLVAQSDDVFWDQGVPIMPSDSYISKSIATINLNEVKDSINLSESTKSICREIGLAFYDKGYFEEAEWYLSRSKGFHFYFQWHKIKITKEKENPKDKISKEDSESLASDANFIKNIPSSLSKLSKDDMKKIANEIDNKIKQLLAEKDSLLKSKAKQEVIDAKDGTIKTLGKEKEIINLTINNDDLKIEKSELKIENKDLELQKDKLRKWLISSAIAMVLLILGIVVLIQRKTIKVQDFEIDEQLKDIAKKNTYLEHAARIIRHDMHSGINTYIPRGISSLEKRVTHEELQRLKIDGSVKMIKEGLNHTQKVYKSVYEFTNLVKQDVVLSKTKSNLTDLLINYFSGTSYGNQVQIDDLPELEVNEILFCNAIDNLVKNGLKYNDSEIKLVKIFFEDDKIIVQDNGRGLTQNQFEKISINYLSKKNKDIDKETTGLGLNICQTIITEHGFGLYCEKNDVGTKMVISLT